MSHMSFRSTFPKAIGRRSTTSASKYRGTFETRTTDIRSCSPERGINLRSVNIQRAPLPPLLFLSAPSTNIACSGLSDIILVYYLSASILVVSATARVWWTTVASFVKQIINISIVHTHSHAFPRILETRGRRTREGKRYPFSFVLYAERRYMVARDTRICAPRIPPEDSQDWLRDNAADS